MPGPPHRHLADVLPERSTRGPGRSARNDRQKIQPESISSGLRDGGMARSALPPARCESPERQTPWFACVRQVSLLFSTRGGSDRRGADRAGRDPSYSPRLAEGREVDGCHESRRCWREGKVVRVFGDRPVAQPQADRDRRRARRLRRALARPGARRADHEGHRAGDDGRPQLRDGPFRPPAGDRLRRRDAPARGGGGRGDDQHGPLAGGGRAGGALGQVLAPGRARGQRRQPRRPLRPDPRWPSTRPGPTPRRSSASRSRRPAPSSRSPRSPPSPTSTCSSSARPT